MAGETPELMIAYCGLVCSNCGMYRKGKCQGCHSDRPMFARCPVKACCVSTGYGTCADCTEFADLKRCGKLHNIISRMIGWIFRSDRIGNLDRIRQAGIDTFKREKHAAGTK